MALTYTKGTPHLMVSTHRNPVAHDEKGISADGVDVIVPTVAADAPPVSTADPLTVRPNLTVALLSNGKVNGTELLAAIGRALNSLVPGIHFKHYRKPSVSVPPEPSDFDDIVRTADAAICAIGDCGSCSSRTMRDAIDLELAGIPSVAVVADALVGPVDYMRRVSGMPDYPFCTTPFPVGNLTADEIEHRGLELAPQVLQLLTERTNTPNSHIPTPRPLTATFPSETDAQEAAYANGWTDGLPVIPPTRDRVLTMLAAAGVDPDEILLTLPTRNHISITAQTVAANAVMAGCATEHFPVVVAAVTAASDPRSNIHAHTATLSGAQQVLVVNGKRRNEWGLNTGEGALGPGTRANATIGRALRLVLRNGARSVHGEFDRATFGHPGRYSWCFGEAEEESPWPPLTTDMGYDAGIDAVSLYATVWQTSTICHSRDAAELLDEIALTARTACHTNWLHSEVADNNSFWSVRPFMFVTGHEHAEVLVAGGYTTKPALQAALHDRLVAPHPTLRPVSIAAADRIHVVYVHATGLQQTLFFGPFQSHALVTAPITTARPEDSSDEASVAELDRALSQIRSTLRADGYDLEITARRGAVEVNAVPRSQEACLDCLMPVPVLEAMVRDALQGSNFASSRVRISRPAAETR
jgi:hypothetical protein